MKNLLSTTALIAGIAFGGAAFAQTTIDADAQYTWTIAVENPLGGDPILSTVIGTGAEYTAQLALMKANPGSDITIVPATLAAYTPTPADDAAPYTSTSLLDNILDDAAALSASISNISQNLNDIDGSIKVDTSRTITAMSSVIESLQGDNPGFGSFSQVNANVFASDLPAALLDVLDPLTLELGALATTAIGTLQSGNMTGKFDSDGLVVKATTAAATGTITNASMMAEQYAGIADTIAMQNVSVNSGQIDGTVVLTLMDVNSKIGTVSTTAIGALQSGTMNADIAGALGDQSQTLTSGIVGALVGQPKPAAPATTTSEDPAPTEG